MLPTIEEAWYFTDMVCRGNIAVKEFWKKCYITRLWLTDIDFFKPSCVISDNQYKMVADILGPTLTPLILERLSRCKKVFNFE